MKALITGMNGTVAPVLAQALTQAGYIPVAWDRSLHPVDHPDAVKFYMACEKPDCLCHLAMGSPGWAEGLAQGCAEQGIPFLYVSSVSVFSGSQTGPFAPSDRPHPDDDYGRYKLECEQRVQTANPKAHVVRIGWQIGSAPGGNQMVDFLDRTFRDQGVIEASTEWFPACSFLTDTAKGLVNILHSPPPGLYHLDGNPGLSFHEIAVALNRLQGQPWKIVPGRNPVRNHRMVDPRVAIAPITSRLKA